MSRAVHVVTSTRCEIEPRNAGSDGVVMLLVTAALPAATAALPAATAALPAATAALPAATAARVTVTCPR